jgi:DNA-binding transcriptional LysR family regulator
LVFLGISIFGIPITRLAKWHGMTWADRIGRRIKLRDLHLLHAVIQSGSMTKAAGALAVSVPVVSKAIADLERAVGVRLLDRNPQGVEPTIYGRALLGRSLAAFDELRQGVRDIEFLADPTAGEVRVGSTIPISASFVTAVIDRLSRRNPRITFNVVATQTETLHLELSARNVDLLIARKFGPVTDELLNFEALYDDPYVVAAGVQNPWARRRRVELADLVNETWVLPPPNSLVGSFAVEAFRASGLDLPRSTVVTFPFEVRNSLLATGRFLTILTNSLLRFPARHPSIKMLPVHLPISSGPIGVFTLKTRLLSPVAQLFIDCAREVAKPLARAR